MNPLLLYVSGFPNWDFIESVPMDPFDQYEIDILVLIKLALRKFVYTRRNMLERCPLDNLSISNNRTLHLRMYNEQIQIDSLIEVASKAPCHQHQFARDTYRFDLSSKGTALERLCPRRICRYRRLG